MPGRTSKGNKNTTDKFRQADPYRAALRYAAIARARTQLAEPSSRGRIEGQFWDNQERRTNIQVVGRLLV